jgi:DNA-binding transcriptional LysR family regulator
MGLTQPAISRQIGALEEHLGTRLFHRSTHNLALTEYGRELLGHARAVLEAVARAETAVGQQHAGTTGLVRLSADMTFGRVVIAPRLHRLLAFYPQLEIDLRLENRPSNMVHEGVDVALREGEIRETSLIARTIGVVSRLIVGSADYLARRPEPQCPEDLVDHDCILLTGTEYGQVWKLERDGITKEIRVSGRFRTDSTEAARVAVNTDLGLAILPGWLMEHELNAGTARPVLPSWQPPRIPVHAVYPSHRNLAPRTRVVIDFLVQEFRADSTLSVLRF